MSIVRSYNPIWLMVDLQGQILDDTYYFFTLQNTLPYLPQPIWQDEDQNVVWSDPIQFLANGTLPTNMYWDDTLVYRLEIRQGNTQADPLIYAINDYKPGAQSGINPVTSIVSSDNQITNPQFGTLNFTGSLVISTATSIEFAPGWVVTTTGAGTLTLSQAQFAGNSYTPDNATNAATGLTCVNAGFTTFSIKQRFDGNGALWTGSQDGSTGAGIALNATISAAVPGGTNIKGSIKFSDGVEDTDVLNINPSSSALTDYAGASALDESTSSSPPDSSWTDIVFTFTGNTTFIITSIQVLGQLDVGIAEYVQITPQRQIDHEFNYYKPQLEYKPIPSYLIAWDFPLNPAQYYGDSGDFNNPALGANKSRYIWDQTIGFQSTANSLTFARDSDTAGLKLGIRAAAVSGHVAIVQYFEANRAREILSQRNALQLEAKISTGTINGSISLFWTTDASLPVLTVGTDKSLISSITGVIPSTAGNGNWTAVPNPVQGDNAPFTLSDEFETFNFSGFDATASSGGTTATFLAVVITFDTLANPDEITINYCSLNGGDIATRPAPQSSDDVLAECEYFLESSYNSGVAIFTGTVFTGSSAGSLVEPLLIDLVTGAGTLNLYAQGFHLNYKRNKRIIPALASSLRIIAVNGTADSFFSSLVNTGVSISSGTHLFATWFAATTINNKFASFIQNSTTAVETSGGATVGVAANGYMQFHYLIDVRLGLF